MKPVNINENIQWGKGLTLWSHYTYILISLVNSLNSGTTTPFLKEYRKGAV